MRKRGILELARSKLDHRKRGACRVYRFAGYR
jgi:hypothetical protein